MERTTILGMPVDLVTEQAAIEWVAKAIKERRSGHIVTLNPEITMQARSNVALADAVSRADLCIPDGVGVVWAARRRGHSLPGRVTGVDLIEALARRGVAERWRFFLLGAAPGVAAEAAAVLQRRYPGLTIVGTLSVPPDPALDAETAARIRSADTNILLVAYGAPAQELWIARNLDRIGGAVAMGVGGAFDFLAGKARRAPTWMQQSGMEWLHRLIRQPWRWRRMLALPKYALLVLREKEPAPTLPSPRGEGNDLRGRGG